VSSHRRDAPEASDLPSHRVTSDRHHPARPRHAPAAEPGGAGALESGRHRRAGRHRRGAATYGAALVLALAVATGGGLALTRGGPPPAGAAASPAPAARGDDAAARPTSRPAGRDRDRLAGAIGATPSASPATLAGCAPYHGNQLIACTLLPAYGFPTNQMPALVNLWRGESDWRTTARNPGSGAYGIPQALPASKMGTIAADWRTNPATQIRWGLRYIRAEYGTPAQAWSKWQARSPHWY
jgi:hypothetical protein